MKKPKRVITILLAIALAAIFIIFISGLTSSALALVQRPFLSAGTWITQTTQSFQSRSSLLTENQRLQDTIESLAVYESELELTRDENENLRLQLDYIKESGYETMTAAVTSRSIEPSGSIISIDRGSDHGLETGQPVFVAEGIVIGKIAETSTTSATVRLLSDRSSQIAATILNNNRTLGIVEGVGGTLLDFRFIPQNVEVIPNNLVVTSGLEEDVPMGLVIGLINSVSTNQTDPFQEAVIEPLVDYRGYTMVSIIIGSTEL